MTTSSTNAGLSTVEVTVLRAEHGPNLPPPARPRSLVGRVGEQLRDPMILLLLAAFVVVALVGDVADAGIILLVVCLNTAIGVVQEVRAAHALDALDRLAAPVATVERDGRFVRIPSAEVVPGDYARLEAGDVVPADAVVVEAGGLEVDESTMTGESVPVSRMAGDELLAGTVLTRGRAYATVVRTGSTSGLGAIATALVSAGARPTPLQLRLARLSGQLVWMTLALAALVLVLGVLRGEPLQDMLVLAVSLAVAAIPESLPAVVTVALALGAHRMAGRHALVRRLPAVETLGSVTVLASDKTGTLTEGQMTVREIWTPDGSWAVDGQGYDADGRLRLLRGLGAPSELLRDVVLCNDARLGGPTGGTWEVVGDPMEAALLVVAAKSDDAARDLAGTWARVDEVPFGSESKQMRTVHRGPAGYLLVCKGAPESVLATTPDDGRARAARSEAVRLAERGYRVLAVADALTDQPPDPKSAVQLTLRGLVALMDPPRSTAREVVKACREAGIRVVMVTGDHPATARAVADDLGITRDAPELVVGDQVVRGGHAGRIEQVGVYARTRPEDKVEIVAAWQRQGEVVAMTGDGVNDAPALRNADIGIAMGRRGTEVARQAADLVLADDDLRTVVAAVGEGRRIHANIRRFLRYGLSGGLAEVLVLLIGPWLGMPMPLLPGQILWLNMITHGVPGVAFGGEPADPADMARPSPSPERSVLGGLLPQIAVTAVLIAVTSLVAGLAGSDTGQIQTSVFLCLGLAQLWLALALRAPRQGTGWRARGLEAAVALAASLLLLAVMWDPLRQLLNTAAASPADVVLLALLSALPAAAVIAVSRVRRRIRRRR